MAMGPRPGHLNLASRRSRNLRSHPGPHRLVTGERAPASPHRRRPEHVYDVQESSSRPSPGPLLWPCEARGPGKTMLGYYLSMVHLTCARARPLSWTHYGNLCLRGTRSPCSTIELGQRHEYLTRNKTPGTASVASSEQHRFYPVAGRRQALKMILID